MKNYKIKNQHYSYLKMILRALDLAVQQQIAGLVEIQVNVQADARVKYRF